MKVPFHRIDTSGNELRNVREVLESGWLTSGERVLDFEKAFAASVGARHAINSCTAALHLACEAECGLRVDADDPRSLARAIEDLASREEESRLELGANGRRYVLEHHDFKKLSTRFIEAIQSKRDQPGIDP